MQMLSRVVTWLYGKPKDAQRSSHWRAMRQAHMLLEPICQWCHGKLMLEVHHIIPFAQDPTRELDPENMITMCELPGLMCHLYQGHKGNWHLWDPRIRKKCQEKWNKEKT